MNIRLNTVGFGTTINTGDIIQIIGDDYGQDSLKVDYLEFTSLDNIVLSTPLDNVISVPETSSTVPTGISYTTGDGFTSISGSITSATSGSGTSSSSYSYSSAYYLDSSSSVSATSSEHSSDIVLPTTLEEPGVVGSTLVYTESGEGFTSSFVSATSGSVEFDSSVSFNFDYSFESFSSISAISTDNNSSDLGLPTTLEEAETESNSLSSLDLTSIDWQRGIDNFSRPDLSTLLADYAIELNDSIELDLDTDVVIDPAVNLNLANLPQLTYDDFLEGGAGHDILVGSVGNDVLNGDRCDRSRLFRARHVGRWSWRRYFYPW